MKLLILESSAQNNCKPRVVWSKELIGETLEQMRLSAISEAEELCQKWYNEGVSNADEGSPEVQLLLYSIEVDVLLA